MLGPGIMSPHHSQLVQPNMMPLLVPNSNPIDPLENILGVFPCAKLKSLPTTIVLDDILLLFNGLVLIDIVIPDKKIEDMRNYLLDDTFVLFANPMDFQMALQRDGQLIGNHYVSISQGKRHEYYDAVSQVSLKRT